jgi:hypothetical protein
MAGDSAEPPSPAAKAPPDSANAKTATEAVGSNLFMKVLGSGGLRISTQQCTDLFRIESRRSTG